MKHFNLKCFTTLIITLFLFTSAHKSIWPNCDIINADGKYYCNQFQFLNGSNRTADFKNVFSIMFNEQNISNNTSYTSNKFEKEEVLKLLGDPTTIISENKYIYSLNPDINNCVAEFEFDEKNNTFTCITRNIH